MTSYLVFQLYGPMAAWGDVAVGESRVSSTLPSRSALLGLLAAALGLKRTDEQRLNDLSASVRFGLLTLSSGHFLRDYHTVQVPPASALKRRTSRTRRDELSIPKSELGTILSARDYRTDASYRVAVERVETGKFELETLRNALLKPVFPLYLGRKACPPSLPLAPRIVEAVNLLGAFRAALASDGKNSIDQPGKGFDVHRIESAPYPLTWEDGMTTGIEPIKSTTRRDQPRTRRRWQFNERIEHQAMLDTLEDTSCT
ncbi:MAG: type I-E CRISPR-associated protein Cas5/CasD [Xanthomonadales bacterium]|nr:type I-E CRISPR-associated protein Cas5/CasD [Xanthomonadales bacterium]